MYFIDSSIFTLWRVYTDMMILWRIIKWYKERTIPNNIYLLNFIFLPFYGASLLDSFDFGASLKRARGTAVLGSLCWIPFFFQPIVWYFDTVVCWGNICHPSWHSWTSSAITNYPWCWLSTSESHLEDFARKKCGSREK